MLLVNGYRKTTSPGEREERHQRDLSYNNSSRDEKQRYKRDLLHILVSRQLLGREKRDINDIFYILVSRAPGERKRDIKDTRNNKDSSWGKKREISMRLVMLEQALVREKERYHKLVVYAQDTKIRPTSA